MTYSTWQEEVEAFVKEKKILKKDLAEAIGVTPVKLSHWLHGRTFLIEPYWNG